MKMTQLFWRGTATCLALTAIAATAIAQGPLRSAAQRNQAAENSNQAQPTIARGEKQGQANRTNSNQNNANSDRSNRNNADDNRVRTGRNTQGVNADARATRRENRGQRRTAMRPTDMRGPDIGLWFNRRNQDGLVISDVSSRGPIAKLGFHERDRIVSVNGHRVSGEPEFIEYLMASDADRVAVVVNRDGREETIYVQPAVFNTEYEYADEQPLEQFGVVLDDRYDDKIVVWKVVPRSPAYYAGVREGDVIITVGDHPYHSRTEFEKGLVGLKSGEADIQVRRGDKTRDLSVDVPDFNESNKSAADHHERADRNERSVVNRRDNSADRDERSADRDDRSGDHKDRSADRDDRRSNDRDRDRDRGHANSDRSNQRDANQNDRRNSDDRNQRQHDSSSNSNSDRDSKSDHNDKKDNR